MRKDEHETRENEELPADDPPQPQEPEAAAGSLFDAIHPLRHEVMAETNARPALPAAAPCICEHLVFLSGELDADKDWETVRGVARQLGKTLGDEAEQQVVLEDNRLIFKWERHTEFCSYTLLSKNPPEMTGNLFETLINTDLIAGGHQVTNQKQKRSSGESALGKPIVALRFYIDTPEDPRWSETGETDLLWGNRIIAVTANGGKTKITTDFNFHADGYARYLIRDASDNPNRAGRLLQRLIDIETYRTLALIAWPLAKTAGRDIGEIDGELRDLIQRIGAAGPEEQARILTELTALAARAETVGAETNFRFSAAKAYHSIVMSRLAELREERIEGNQRLSTFIERRLGPAIRSFQAILDRQNSTAARIARASSLLRTRVDVELERQNQELLASMDRRSSLQLRLQQTVEGLSVAAVSYYCIGILSWLLKGIPKNVLPVDPAVITTAAVPFIVFSIWMMVRRIRKSAHDD